MNNQIITAAKTFIAERTELRAHAANTLNTFPYASDVTRSIAELTFDVSIARLDGKLQGLIEVADLTTSSEIIEMDRVASLSDNSQYFVRDLEMEKHLAECGLL